MLKTTTKSRNNFLKLLCTATLVAFWWLDPDSAPSTGEDGADLVDTAVDVDVGKFAGQCTVDCSGHQAGYDWAELHDIEDGHLCDDAGDHSSSPSFAEGCHVFVDR